MRYRILALAFAMALAALFAAPTWASGQIDDGAAEERPVVAKPAYERAIINGLDRVQKGLESEIDLFVDHSTWENAWVLRSEHFEVRTTRSKKFGLGVLRGCETMYAWFQYVLGMSLAPDDYIPIEVRPDLAAYNARAGNAGHHSSKYGCFVLPGEPTTPVVTFYSKDETGGRRFITHGALSSFLAKVCPIQPPLWLDEGLACYFEMHWDFANVITAWRTMRERNRFIPLRVLIDDGIAAYTDDHFLQLGMLVYYLLYEREDTRIVKDETGAVTTAPFRDYVRRVLAGESIAAADPVRQLLEGDLDQLEEDFKAHSFGRQPAW